MEGSASVDGDSDVYTFLAPMPYDEDNAYGARVVVKSADGQVLQYLDVYQDGQSWGWDMDIGHPDEGYVGTPWNQSIVSEELLQECYFQMQIGHDVWNYSTEEYDWTTILYSDNVKPSPMGHTLAGDVQDGSNYTLDGQHENTYKQGSLSPLTALPWTPEAFYTIAPPIDAPEPSSGTLFLLGTALLFLKRRKSSVSS